jgi:hypothetical protein
MHRLPLRSLSCGRAKAKASGPAISSAPVYEWFTEGLDTTDFKDAKALLDELE